MSGSRTLCSSCGFSNLPEARFCGGCGQRLARPEVGSLPLAAVHTPRHLAERILASGGVRRGERKLVTVMFADVHGSLDMIGGRDAEQAQVILDALLRTMVDAVHRYEGTVNQILGDGIMAIFGAPIAHEDHAVRAACAALAIQDAMRPGAGAAWEKLGAVPQVRIGLNSGVVIIAAMNNDLTLDYRAVGPTTHVASRMEQTAAPGTVRLTRDTLQLAEGFVHAEPLGRLVVKGIPDAIEVFELRRINTGGTRFRTRVARGLTPLIGRCEEIELLATALQRAVDSTPSVIALHGEPGVGKSRLCFEVTRMELTSQFRVIECGASTHEAAAAYSAIAALFRTYFQIASSGSREDLQARVLGGLSDLGIELASERAVVLGLLDIAPDDPQWQELEPERRKNRVFSAARAFLRQICRERPCLLIFEDVHALDAASLDFIDDLLKQPPGDALLVLLTSRVEMKSWAAHRIVRRHLLPLPPEHADVMLRQLLGDTPALASLRRRLIDRTYGNPFFLEEMLRALLASGTLCGESGRYELSTPNPTIEVPPSATALIAARIDSLAPEVKSLIQTAAVLGTEMTVELLRRISDLDEASLRTRLRAAAESEIMYETQLFPTPSCGFRHALTHEVAYQSVLQSERKMLHARVVGVLEDVHRDRLTEHVERLAEHSHAGELWEKSARYHLMAVARAASRFANQQAVQILDRGLGIVERLPCDRTRAEFSIDLRLAGLAALLPLGEHERISNMLSQAEAIASRIDDQPRLGAILAQMSTAAWVLGQHQYARSCAERALAIAQKQQRFSLGLSARFGLVLANHALGDLEACIDSSRQIVRELECGLELKRFGWAGYPSVMCRSFLASALMFRGEFEEALPCLQQGCRVADEAGQPYSRVIMHSQMGLYHTLRGEPERALTSMLLAHRVAYDGELRTAFAPVSGWLGVVLTELGRPQEAIDVVLDAFDPEGRRVSHYGHVYTLDALAFAYARLGHWPKAFGYAQEAVERTRACGEYAHHVSALVRLALLQAQRGPSYWTAAEHIYREALNRAQARRMRPLAAACHEGLALLASRAGRSESALEERTTALELYRSMKLFTRAQRCETSIPIALA